jgi:hypothetical protein
MSAAPSIETLLAQAPRAVRKNFALWQKAAAAMEAAPNGRKHRVARQFARKLAVGVNYIYSKCSQWRKRGDIVLLNKQFSSLAWNRRQPAKAPRDTVRARRRRNILNEIVLRQYRSGQWRVVKQSRPPAP